MRMDNVTLPLGVSCSRESACLSRRKNNVGRRSILLVIKRWRFLPSEDMTEGTSDVACRPPPQSLLTARAAKGEGGKAFKVFLKFVDNVFARRKEWREGVEIPPLIMTESLNIFSSKSVLIESLLRWQNSRTNISLLILKVPKFGLLLHSIHPVFSSVRSCCSRAKTPVFSRKVKARLESAPPPPPFLFF